MCGLYGWKFGEQIPVEKRVIIATVLAMENETRGKDSWGVLNLQTKGVLRELGKVTKGVHKFCMLPEALCHTRFATTGAVTIENAHPFEYKHIIGAHNGVVENHWQLNSMKQREFNVDSQQIFAHIADDEKKQELRAYGAITYLDTREEGGLFLCKFNGGVLNVYSVNVPYEGEEDAPGMILWSSTQNAIETALTVAGLDGFAWQVEEGKVYEIKEYTLFNTIKTLGFDSPFSRRAVAKGNYTGINQQYMTDWDHGTGYQKQKNTPYYDNGEIIWNKCCMCGRWLRVTRIGTDDVCAMCEDVYRENDTAEANAKALLKGKELTVVELGETEATASMGGLCDYCGSEEADFHIPALQGIVCGSCMAIIDVELSSGMEVKLLSKEKKENGEKSEVGEVIETLVLAKSNEPGWDGQDWESCDGAWRFTGNA
jgi:hypothetical protein